MLYNLLFINSFRQGVKIPYEGERKKEDIVEFALKTAGPVITQLESLAQFDEVSLLFCREKQNSEFLDDKE
jgi:hypothetical protein